MKDYPFYTAYSHMETFYGITLPPDDFETMGLSAWDKVGNKRTRWYKYTAVPEKDSLGQWYIDLPCNCDIIEAVTAGYEDYQKTSSTHMPGELQNGWGEDYIEGRKFHSGFGYIPGKYIKYSRENNRLLLADEFQKVNVLYKGVLTDEEGLPSLNEKEIEAIASYCAFVDTRKKALVTRDGGLMQLAGVLELEWKKLCTQARIPDRFSQNEMDEILNVSTSWDRKRFGKSFKPIR